jgi:hypothetical protein
MPYSTLSPSCRAIILVALTSPCKSIHISHFYYLPYSRRTIHSSLNRLISLGWFSRTAFGYYCFLKKYPAKAS